MNRIGGIGYQHRIAPFDRGQCQMCQPFLGSDRDDGLGLGVEIDVVTTLVPVTNRTSQSGYTSGRRVSVGVLTTRDLNELFDDVSWRWAIWISHAKVDDVFAGRACTSLEIVYNGEDIRRKSPDSRKVHASTRHWPGEEQPPPQAGEGIKLGSPCQRVAPGAGVARTPGLTASGQVCSLTDFCLTTTVTQNEVQPYEPRRGSRHHELQLGCRGGRWTNARKQLHHRA